MSNNAPTAPPTTSLALIPPSTGVVKDGWNGFNVIHDTASRVAALDMGFAPSAASRASKTAPKVVYLLGADDWDETEVPAGAFVIYQGHHGDRGAARADVILPGAAYTEKSGLYVNFEGRVQQTRAAVPVLGEAREDWAIVRALSEVLGKRLSYDDLAGVRARLADLAPHFANINSVQVGDKKSTAHVKRVWACGKMVFI